ncbi:MAG: HD domain-containing protein [Lachnospiraceae bacterium]|nr:HD domain-containing protein [Lachnospiraceae bacterium]MBQ9233891.1 HD domain-containing protein [Lachnospiraceae bacterium]
MNYSEVIEYVKKMTAENGRPSNYPFRSRYEHTMRVYRWAIKLQAKLGGDIDIIALAALLHDVGWDSERPHEEVGAELAVDFLDELGVEPEIIKRVGEIIMIHEDKDTEAELSLECKIVMDADLLDEVGAVSVIWDSMATACEDEPSYKKAYYRIKNYYRINKPKIRRCKTDAARAEYTKRMQLLESYINQLEKELF